MGLKKGDLVSLSKFGKGRLFDTDGLALRIVKVDKGMYLVESEERAVDRPGPVYLGWNTRDDLIVAGSA